MKKFEVPSIEVEKLESVDVITTSTCSSDCAADTPECPDDFGFIG